MCTAPTREAFSLYYSKVSSDYIGTQYNILSYTMITNLVRVQDSLDVSVTLRLQTPRNTCNTTYSTQPQF